MIFYCRGYERVPCRCGCCPPEFSADEHVRAATEWEALGFLLEAYQTSKPEWWNILPLPDEGESGILFRDEGEE